jgi:DNA-binding response OmpR family regulator
MLTARDALSDKVTGLDAGADDYLTKPFDMPELIARLRAAERRSTSHSNSITIGSVTLDSVAHTVTVKDSLIDLSKREYMLLKALMDYPSKIYSRENLESRLYNWGEEVSSNAIEVHMHNLRKKLGVDLIKTVRGIGYTINRS